MSGAKRHRARMRRRKAERRKQFQSNAAKVMNRLVGRR